MNSFMEIFNFLGFISIPQFHWSSFCAYSRYAIDLESTRLILGLFSRWWIARWFSTGTVIYKDQNIESEVEEDEMGAVISRCEVIKPLIVRRETWRRAIFEHWLLKQPRLRSV